MSSPAIDTLIVHAGRPADESTGALRPAVYFSSAYAQPDVAQAAQRFSGSTRGFTYGRTSNPTNSPLEAALATLDGAPESVAFANGQSALRVLFDTLLRQGDEFLISRHLFGGTFGFASGAQARFGWTPGWIDPTNPASAASLITPKTKFILIESVSNPDGVVADLDGYRALADQHRLPLVIDNTLPTPYLLDAGRVADVVLYSGTKYLNGHGTGLSGFITDTGRFNWQSDERYPAIAAPRGIDLPFTSTHSHAPLAAAVRFYGTGHGGVLTPHEAFLTLNGLDTLALRLDRQVSNTQQIAHFLQEHPAVESVQYSGLPSSPHYARAQKYLPRGAGALLAFNVLGGRDAAITVAENLSLFSLAANIGQTRSLVVHPATTTHRQSEDQRRAAGIGPNTLRLSIGIENPVDLIHDLGRALEIASKGTARQAILTPA